MTTVKTASPMLLRSLAPKQPRLPRLPASRPPTPSARAPFSLSAPLARAFSLSAPLLSKPYDFAAIQSLAATPRPTAVLIDVREPAEFAAGHIPGAVNVPVGSAPDALLLPADEFGERFGFDKPGADVDAVFYCKAGVRSRAAAQIAERAGYTSVGDYSGSWLDWVAKGGKVAR